MSLMKKNNIIASVLFAASMICDAQVSVFTPSVTSDGINYMLPKTALRAEVSAIKVIYMPGEYSRYAERYLHMSGAKAEAEVAWEVTGLKVCQVGVPDTLKRYSVKAKDKNFLPKVQLTEDGIIQAINTVVGSVPEGVSDGYSTHHKLNYKKYLTEEMLAATSTSKMAELIAAEILEIRESKSAILRGQAESMPKDGVSMKLILDELNAQEEAYTQLFVGYTDTVYCSAAFTVVPQEDVEKEVFFRFSKRLGFVDDDDYAGEPYYYSFADEHTVTLPTEKEQAKRKLVGIV